MGDHFRLYARGRSFCAAPPFVGYKTVDAGSCKDWVMQTPLDPATAPHKTTGRGIPVPRLHTMHTDRTTPARCLECSAIKHATADRTRPSLSALATLQTCLRSSLGTLLLHSLHRGSEQGDNRPCGVTQRKCGASRTCHYDTTTHLCSQEHPRLFDFRKRHDVIVSKPMKPEVVCCPMSLCTSTKI
jgi:hypothetical protein